LRNAINVNGSSTDIIRDSVSGFGRERLNTRVRGA